MGFSRQEHWSELPFPSPGDLLNPGIEPRSPTLQADVKNIKSTFDSDCIQSVDCFDSMAIFIILILPVQEHVIHDGIVVPINQPAIKFA